MASSSTVVIQAGDRLGPYTLTRELGHGGMGRVFLAYRSPDPTALALKLMRDELAEDDRLTRRFLREAQATAAVRHRRLIDVIDAGTADGRLFIAMRHLEGSTLERCIAEREERGFQDVVRIVADVAGALDALHSAGLRHRDVKPSNIMVDRDGHATLMDLGLVTSPALSVITSAGSTVGTLAYLAPELIRGSSDASPASDIYALGCVAFEALTGRPPFTGGMIEVGIGHLDRQPPAVHELRRDLPPAVSQAIAFALAKEPERRPPTATTLATLLRVSAVPPATS